MTNQHAEQKLHWLRSH